MKICTKCKGEKSEESDFHKDKHRPDGLRAWCKKCAIPASLAWHNRNKRTISKRNRVYKEKHKEKFLVWCARHRAKKSGVAFSITEADVMIPESCPILGIPLFMGTRHNPNSPSLDRVDNTLGYVKGNVQVISYRANALKKDASIKELKGLANWVRLLYGA